MEKIVWPCLIFVVIPLKIDGSFHLNVLPENLTYRYRDMNTPIVCSYFSTSSHLSYKLVTVKSIKFFSLYRRSVLLHEAARIYTSFRYPPSNDLNRKT